MPDSARPGSRRVSIIRNPHARRPPSDAALGRAIEAIRHAGWTATVVDTTARGDAARIAGETSAAGVDVVVVCGGDGTINEAVNGLAGSETALAVIPGGTANVWAREVGIATDPVAALGLLDGGRRVRVDVGVARIGDRQPRRFLLMCSAGLDAETVRVVEDHPTAKRRLGRAVFGWPGLKALGAHAVQTSLIVGDEQRNTPLLMVLAGNSQLYGSVVRLTAEAVMDDGELDLVTFEDAPGSLRRVAQRRTSLLVRALRGGLRSTSADGIHYRRTASAELRPAGPLPVQADGEFIGIADVDAPLKLSVEPRSLTLLVPAGVNSLFSGGDPG